MNKSNLNFLIVEDDPTYAIRLEMLVEELGYAVLEKVDNSGRALELIYRKKPDFILMDIEIKGEMTGLDIADAIKNLDIPILFITSFNDPSVYSRAEGIGAVAFLVKPIDGYSLKSAIKLAVKNIYLSKGKKMEKESDENQFLLDDYFFIKKDTNFHKVNIKDILLFEAEGSGYTKIYTAEMNTFTTRSNLSYFETNLPEPAYMRVHRSFIVQVARMDSIDQYGSSLQILGKTIPISRQKQRDLSVLINKVI